MVTIVEMWLDNSVMSCYNSTAFSYRTFHSASRIKIFSAQFVYIGTVNSDFIADTRGVAHTFIRVS